MDYSKIDHIDHVVKFAYTKFTELYSMIVNVNIIFLMRSQKILKKGRELESCI